MAPSKNEPLGFDLIAHLHRQRAFSEKTFGPGPRTRGVLDHIRKELVEIEKDPTDLEERVDLILLALDGAWRAGHSPEAIAAAIEAKQTKNEGRPWPDWRTMSPDQAIEHVRPPVACAACGTPIAKFIREGDTWHPCAKCGGAKCEKCCEKREVGE